MNVIIFDTETTGLPQPSSVPLSRQPQIIELGALKLDTSTGAELGTLSQLLDPNTELPSVITKITGLTDSDLAGKPTFRQFLPQLTEFFRGADVLIAHNAEFDKTMLRLELTRLGVDDFPWPKATLCTAEEFGVKIGYRPRLVDAFEYFTGSKLEQTHRALDDCRALLACCERSGLFELLL